MKMQVISKEDIPIYKGAPISVYDEIYETIDGLEPGKALVVDWEDPKKAMLFAGAMSNHILYDKKHDGRFKNCYYTKSGNYVIVGKN